MTIHPYLNIPGVAISAHRGGGIEAPENTMESFQYAIEIGSSYIETDVQLSADGIPYIFHDDDLKRLFGKDIIFNSLNSEQIEQLKLFDLYSIPKLESVLHKFPNTFFQIDVKTDEVTLPAMRIIEKTHSLNRVCMASFSSERLKKIHSLYPNVCLSMGPSEIFKLFLSSYGVYRKKIPGNCLQIPIYQYGIKLATKRFIKYAQSMGLKIHVWTINDADTMQKLINLGVDGIITDKPKILRDLLLKN